MTQAGMWILSRDQRKQFDSTSDGLGGRSHRPLEGPGPDVIDLLLHGSREGDDFQGYFDEILLRYFAVGEPRLCHGRYDALLDLGPGPAARELGQLLKIESSRVDPPAGEVNFEDLDLFVFERQVHEKHFV